MSDIANDDATTDRLAHALHRQRDVLFGKYRGKVTKVGTGENLGRIKALIPAVFGDDLTESPWCEPVVPFAGEQHGLVFLPEKDDGVWIEFEGGNRSRPLWTGFFWGKDQLPKAASDKVRVLATRRGHQLVIDDGADEIRIEHGSGPKVTLTKSSITLEVQGKKLVLDASGLSVNDGALKVT